METFNGYDGEGNMTLCGYQHHSVKAAARAAHRAGQVVELIGSVSGTWVVGPRGGLRRPTKAEKRSAARDCD